LKGSNTLVGIIRGTGVWKILTCWTSRWSYCWKNVHPSRKPTTLLHGRSSLPPRRSQPPLPPPGRIRRGSQRLAAAGRSYLRPTSPPEGANGRATPPPAGRRPPTPRPCHTVDRTQNASSDMNGWRN
jgi:hypothetical protein